MRQQDLDFLMFLADRSYSVDNYKLILVQNRNFFMEEFQRIKKIESRDERVAKILELQPTIDVLNREIEQLKNKNYRPSIGKKCILLPS